MTLDNAVWLSQLPCVTPIEHSEIPAPERQDSYLMLRRSKSAQLAAIVTTEVDAVGWAKGGPSGAVFGHHVFPPFAHAVWSRNCVKKQRDREVRPRGQRRNLLRAPNDAPRPTFAHPCMGLLVNHAVGCRFIFV
jgi:hypothetical protein